MPRDTKRRRVCFVTGTRAEFGLMTTALAALRDHPRIELQIIATGAHTQRGRGDTLREIRADGWRIDAVVPWPDDTRPAAIARHTGEVTAKLVDAFERLKSDVVLVVGDRVEAFAAATAAHLSGRVLAHVHGGDRAMGQVDDALRHAISKLAHIHFAATAGSGERLRKMGEDRSRVHLVGAPGIDGIREQALSRARVVSLSPGYGGEGTDLTRSRAADKFILLLLHPTDPNDAIESQRTERLLRSLAAASLRIVALAPNADPGSAGIARVLERAARAGRIDLLTHAARPQFLALLRDCRALIGNSSSGIIEAGSFGTPVLDIGPRQQGRERGSNVVHCEWTPALLAAGIRRVLRARRKIADNPYDRGGAGKRITRVLAGLKIDDGLRRKVIRY